MREIRHMTDALTNFLSDLLVLLRDMAAHAKSRLEVEGDFQAGRLHAVYEAITLIKDQIIAFGFDPAQVGMPPCDPDRDIL